MRFVAKDGEAYCLNLIDTPGHVDFSYEVSRSLAACEGALLVVDASQGVEAQTLANVYLALENNLEIIPIPPRVPSGVSLKLRSNTLSIGRACARAPAYYDPYRGVIVYFRVVDGSLKRGDRVRFMASAKEYEVDEIGVLSPAQQQVDELFAGEVGYLAASIRSVADARVGDTITQAARQAEEALPGYLEATPMVYCGLFPVEADSAMGFGFRCGFLGLLHMEIVQERLEREYSLNLITTAPSVVYRITCRDGTTMEMITPREYIGTLMELAQERRGDFVEIRYVTDTRAAIVYDMPLGEVVGDFFDQLKSRSKGYASMEYHLIG
eukprot:jgi/Mesen1/774/ME000110S_11043